MADEDYDFPGSKLVDVRILESKAHSELCAAQSYCLNGGTCYRLPSLGVHYCECAANFEGKRCHMKTMSIDIEAAKTDDVEFNWQLVKPLVIVAGGVLVCAMALIFVYFLISYSYRKFSDRKGKYTLAKKSTSHDALVIEVEENFVDGDVTQRTRKASISRPRLAACSSTPEQAKPFHVQTTPTATTTAEALQKLLTLSEAAELGQADFAARNPSEEKKQMPTAEALSSIGRPRSFYGASVEATQNVASLTQESEDTLANCQSPSDSNNNEEVETRGSSVSKHPLEQRLCGQNNKRPTDFGQQKIIPPFDDNSLHRYNRPNSVSVSSNLNENDALYDSDPDATAL